VNTKDQKDDTMTSTAITAAAAQFGLTGLDALPDADQAPLLGTLAALFIGFQERNADKLANVYVPDADWVNAFGSVKKGDTEIVDYLRGLFADQNFNDGRFAAPPASNLRVVSDNVVIVSTHLQVTGQGLVGGDTIALRDNHSLHVLQKRADGAWRVVSEMYMDVRQDHSYINHS
jgi:uncharacterized protein (TIGR02246 family)